MGFVASIAIFSTVYLRNEVTSANADNYKMLARQQARFAFEQALGELQRLAGPDTRSIASGAFFFDEAAYPSQWTGVWDSGRWDPREPQERFFLGWLVSGQRLSRATDPLAAKAPGGPLARFAEGARTYWAPMEAIALEQPGVANHAPQGRIAWLVHDESQKVRINLPDTSEDRVPTAYGLSTLVSCDATFASEQLPAIVEAGQLELLLPPETLFPEHLLTTHAQGVLCDTRRGGLRRALLPILYGESDPGFDLIELPEAAPDIPLPSWDLWRSQLSSDATVSASSAEAALQPRGWNLTWRPGAQEWNSVDAQEAQRAGFGPVLLRALVRLDAHRDSLGNLWIGYQLVVALWNPYDTALADHRYSLHLNEPLEGIPKVLGLNAEGAGVGAMPENNFAPLSMSGHDPEQPLALLTATLQADFAPGEVRLFSTRAEQIPLEAPLRFSLDPGLDLNSAVWRQTDRALPLGACTLTFKRAVNIGGMAQALGWRDLEWELADAQGTPIQIVAGLGHSAFVGDDGTFVPRDVESRTKVFADASGTKGDAVDSLEDALFDPQMSAFYVRKCALPSAADPLHETGPWLAWQDPTAPISVPGRYQYWSNWSESNGTKPIPGNWAWRGHWMDPAEEALFNAEKFLLPAHGEYFGSGFHDSLALCSVVSAREDWFSLGQLRHLRLGLPDGRPARFGDSDANPRIPIMDTWHVHTPRGTGWRKQPEQERLVDATWQVNEALWDRLYCFGEVSSDEAGNWQAASPRLTARKLAQTDTWPAEVFTVAGPFNVNTADAQAWLALLASGLSLNAPEAAVPFARFVEKPETAAMTWAEPSMLDVQDHLRPLAEALAEEVRARGPFMGLADFVNRRLTADAQEGLRGTLAAALRTSKINGTPPHVLERNLAWLEDAALAEDAGYGLPGRLSQGDLLEKLGPILTARGDTFTIHAYAEALNPLTGAVEATARCRAVVQRGPVWLDASDRPGAALDEALAPVNQHLGRRFVLVSFAWVQ